MKPVQKAHFITKYTIELLASCPLPILLVISDIINFSLLLIEEFLTFLRDSVFCELFLSIFSGIKCEIYDFSG